MRFFTVYLLSLLSFSTHAITCDPNQFFVRGHIVDAYTRTDGSFVNSYFRESYCKKLLENYEFKDSKALKPNEIKAKIKPWSDTEKKAVTQLMSQLPQWLSRFETQDIIRGDTAKGNESNPATIIPSSRTLVLYDDFFNRKNQQVILIHEISHIAVLDFNPEELKDFFISNGWVYISGKPPIPPKILLLPDSANSPSEDFANHVEIFYSNPRKLIKHNRKSYELLKKMISNMEKKHD